jgi:tetratricopeptide (TPR) repeat protein
MEDVMSRAEKQRRRQRRLEKHRRSRRLDLSRCYHLPGDVQLISYDISFEPLETPGVPPLDLSDDERYQLFEQAQNDPAPAIERINLLLARYPNHPVLLNWLYAAYNQLHDNINADIIAQRNFEANLGYLFARLNYAAMHLAKGDLAKVDEILDHKYELKLLYPEREVFHVTEVIAMNALMVQYWMRKQKPEAAKGYYRILTQIAPEHPTTLQVQQIMEGSLLLQLAKRLSRSLGSR